MKEFIEKLISRLEELKTIELNTPCGCDDEETDDDGEQIFEDGRSQGKYEQTNIIIRLVKKLAEEFATETNVGNKDGWIPCIERYPETNEYILLSFTNFSVPMVGRYEEDTEGGAFYIGDEDETCVSQDMFVNAWMPLPKNYKESEE